MLDSHLDLRNSQIMRRVSDAPQTHLFSYAPAKWWRHCRNGLCPPWMIRSDICGACASNRCPNQKVIYRACVHAKGVLCEMKTINGLSDAVHLRISSCSRTAFTIRERQQVNKVTYIRNKIRKREHLLSLPSAQCRVVSVNGAVARCGTAKIQGTFSLTNPSRWM